MDSRELVRVSELLVQKVELVEEKLHQFPVISPAAHENLFLELEQAQKDLKDLRAQVPLINVFSQIKINTLLEGLEDKIITLYGRLDNKWLDSEIGKINEAALHLEKVIETPLKASGAKEITALSKALKEHISWICENHRLLIKDRKVIAFAKNILKQAEDVASGKKHLNTPVYVHNSIFTQARIQEHSFASSESDMDALELFEIADLFYQNKTQQALTQYNQLSEYPKKKVDFHLSGLKTGLFTEDKSMIQALIAAAFEISDSSDGEPVLTPSQIDTLFHEAHQFRMQEVWETDLSFKSRVSLTG